jgi:hypothetical protein
VPAGVEQPGVEQPGVVQPGVELDSVVSVFLVLLVIVSSVQE